MSPNGSYFYSKFQNSGAAKFSHNNRDFQKDFLLKSKRKYSINIIADGRSNPGPGQYEARGINLNSPQGKYSVSSYKSALGAKFGCEKRPLSAITSPRYSFDNTTAQSRRNQNSQIIQTSPGPGDYRMLSEFGRYKIVQDMC